MGKMNRKIISKLFNTYLTRPLRRNYFNFVFLIDIFIYLFGNILDNNLLSIHGYLFMGVVKLFVNIIHILKKIAENKKLPLLKSKLSKLISNEISYFFPLWYLSKN